jgi:hypothetical protein
MPTDEVATWRQEYDEWRRECAQERIATAEAFGAAPTDWDLRLADPASFQPDWDQLHDLPAGFRRIVSSEPRTWCMDDILIDGLVVGAVSHNDDLDLWQAHDVAGAIIGRVVRQAAAVAMVVHRAGYDGLVAKADDSGR